jgi:hypothetical protein
MAVTIDEEARLVLPTYPDLPVAFAGLRIPLDVERYRYPRVLVEATIGPIRLTYTVAARKAGRVAISPPATSDALPAVRVPPDLQEAIHAVVLAAVARSTAAKAVLDSKRPRKRQAA